MQEFGSEITQEALNHMEALQRNITEALRINPPLTLLLRQVKKSFAVTTSSGKTYVVPKVLLFVMRCHKCHLPDRTWRLRELAHLRIAS